MIDCARPRCPGQIDVLATLKAHSNQTFPPPKAHPIRCECGTCHDGYYLLLRGNTALLGEILGWPGPPFEPLSNYAEAVDMTWSPTAVDIRYRGHTFCFRRDPGDRWL
ncbi:MAG: hypothetical protein AAFY78_17900 [Cyanobacteria bacterium J06648_16]